LQSTLLNPKNEGNPPRNPLSLIVLGLIVLS
jgi:hypothetical protein